MKGYLLALCSILLVSGAQLLLRWSMQHMPAITTLSFTSVQDAPQPFLLLLCGLSAYGLSMLCWIISLRYLPLSRAYPLLSLSYILVWLAAVLLPAFGEAFRWSSFTGMIMIVLGLLCVCLPARQR